MSQLDTTQTVIPYERQLDGDLEWAFMEGDKHFNEQSRPFLAMKKIAKRLTEIGVPYAIVGGMAMFRHGLRRFTEDVDILVTKETLKIIHENLVGLGYLPPHGKSNHLRDTELGVKIDFLTTGDFPGDGKQKPVAFPDPATVATEIEGIKCINVETLVELKLASGMSGAGRQKDFGDAQELMRVRRLPRSFETKLNPYVRAEFFRLWDDLHSGAESDDGEPQG